MATLVLGSLVSSSALTGVALYAATAAAGLVGSYIDNLLFPAPVTETPTIEEISLTSSAEGASIKRHWGTIRIGGNIIWAANFKEIESKVNGGGKGIGGGNTQTETTYSLSFAIGFCEGNSRCSIGRAWADGKIIDLSSINYTFYPGSETQSVDPTMEGVEGTGKVPAYRGLAYIVFTDLILTDYGNRVPQITVEIFKPQAIPEENSVEELIQGVTLIAATGEASYAVEPTTFDDKWGNTIGENVSANSEVSDIELSLDNLSAALPNNNSINVMIAQFASHPEANVCEFNPKVSSSEGTTFPIDWNIGVLDRLSSDIFPVTKDPLFKSYLGGGTPSDTSVVQSLIKIANDEEKDISFYPLVLLDLPLVELPLINGNAEIDATTGWTTTQGNPMELATINPEPKEGVQYFKGSNLSLGIHEHYQDIILPAGDIYEGQDLIITWYRAMFSAFSHGRSSMGMEFFDYNDTSLGIVGFSPSVGYMPIQTWSPKIIYSQVIPKGSIKVRIYLRMESSNPFFVSPREALVDDIHVYAGKLGAENYGAFPWRGRITSTNDKSVAAQTDVDSLFGTVDRTDFSVSGTVVTFNGTASDWGYRRMVLHYAHLCAATVVDSFTDQSKFKKFYIGSEMIGITQLRSTASSTATGSTIYPGVNALVSLLEEVRSLFDSYGLINVELSYVADWSEFHSHRPDDGTNDVYFNMDALWGHTDCDFVAINNQFPVSDWRSGTSHLDYGAGVDSYGNVKSLTLYNNPYIQGQIEGGELFDYEYTSITNRDSQTRTAIVDVTHSEHWIYRQKDIRNWWANTHRSRPAGIRDAAPTALGDGTGGTVDTWGANVKRFVFPKFGVPCVDLGTNQPHVLYDSKSIESAFPFYSSGNRDDYIQRVYFESMLTYWRDNAPTVGIVKLIDPSEMYAYTWDTRPYPVFPIRSDLWRDTELYDTGYWMNGRVGSYTLSQIVKEICLLSGLDESSIDVSGLVGSSSLIRGYVIDKSNSPREMLSILSSTYLFDGFESEGKLKFIMRRNTIFTQVDLDDLVPTSNDPGGFSLVRAQETELPGSIKVTFIDDENNYQTGSAGGIRLIGSSDNVRQVKVPIVLNQSYARMLSEILIQESWTGRERGELKIPPSLSALDPGDGLEVTLNNRVRNLRIGRLTKGDQIDVSVFSTETSIYDTDLIFEKGLGNSGSVSIFGKSAIQILDIPLISGEEPSPWAPRLASFQSPFPASVLFYKGTQGGSLSLYSQITKSSIMGETITPLPSALPWKFDHSNILSVKLTNRNAQLFSVTETEVLDGANTIAAKTSKNTWEIIQFTTATLIRLENGFPIYDLSGLLRGQLGTEPEIESSLVTGTELVFLDEDAIQVIDLTNTQKTSPLTYLYGPSNLENTSAVYQPVSHTGQAVGLLPYSPVHLKKTPTVSSTEVTFSWIRRTRFGGDDFEAEFIPLNEEEEAYDLEIYDPSGPTLLRSIVNNLTPNYVYTTAQQSSDGGALASYIIKVYQKSTDIGRGREATATL